MKKLFCMMLVLLMMAAGLSVQAEEAVWDFDYTNYKMNGYMGEGGAVVIPEDMEGCTVDILGMYLFNDNDAVTSLTLPSTLKQIEESSIAFCDGLTELIIPEGVQIIGSNCVIGNPGLTELVIPASVRYIGASSFGSNENLKKVTFLGECPDFAGAAFDWIADGAEIYVPDDQYDTYAAALTDAECYAAILPSGANAVVYDWATAPEMFEFDAATGTITAFYGYDTCVEIPAEIDGVAVKAIGEYAFSDNIYLCYLTLPEGIETIGASAFEWCNELVHIDFPSTLKTIGNRAFYAGYMGDALDIPAVETIGDEAFAQCIRISDPIYLPEGIRTIGNSAFYCCSWMTEMYFPASLETIGELAFGDSSVNYMVFEGVDLPEIAANAFENCWYLADIDLNTKASKQQMIDMQAKVDAMNLTCRVWRMQNPDVDYIYDGLDTYENGVMTGYTGEQTHLRPWDTYDDYTVTAIGDGVFKDNQTIEYFSVPYNDMFTTIGAEAFAGSSLRVVDLFDSVTTICDGAFRDCVNIEELYIPESVTSVGSGALAGCTGLKKLIVMCDPSILPADMLEGSNPEMEIYAAETASDEAMKHLSSVAGRAWNNPVTRIGEPLPEVTAMEYEPLPAEDFWYDTEFARLDRYQGYELNLILPREIDGVQLTMVGGDVLGRAMCDEFSEAELPVVSVVIPETYTEIAPYAFMNCDALETVICYAPIEKLDDGTFQNCTSLREVIFVNGVHSIGEYVFDNCPNLQTVYIGQYAENISEFAFLDMFGEPLWSVESCITDPAQLPDVDAMLEAVKCEPMAEPEPTPEPMPAMPVGEEGKDFFGMWVGTEMDMGGELMKLSDWEMTMTLILLEDGRAVMSDEEITDLSTLDEYELPAWYVEDGVAYSEGYAMTILDDGRLLLDEDGFLVYFERSAEQIELPAAPVQPGAPAAPEEPAAPADDAQRTGIKYACDVAYASGFPLYPSQIGEYSVIFYDDGTADIVISGIEVFGLNWTEGVAESGESCYTVDYYTNMLEFVWEDDGCNMNFMGTMDMHFVPEN